MPVRTRPVVEAVAGVIAAPVLLVPLVYAAGRVSNQVAVDSGERGWGPYALALALFLLCGAVVGVAARSGASAPALLVVGLAFVVVGVVWTLWPGWCEQHVADPVGREVEYRGVDDLVRYGLRNSISQGMRLLGSSGALVTIGAVLVGASQWARRSRPRRRVAASSLGQERRQPRSGVVAGLAATPVLLVVLVYAAGTQSPGFVADRTVGQYVLALALLLLVGGVMGGAARSGTSSWASLVPGLVFVVLGAVWVLRPQWSWQHMADHPVTRTVNGVREVARYSVIDLGLQAVGPTGVLATLGAVLVGAALWSRLRRESPLRPQPSGGPAPTP